MSLQILDASVLGLEPGTTLRVKYYGSDPVSGATRLSRKAVTVAASTAVRAMKKAPASSSSSVVDNAKRL